jgi:Spy/CpxP family protein refolding chaperone
MRKRNFLLWIGFFAVCMAADAFPQVGLKDIPLGKWWVKRQIIRELALTVDQQNRIEALWTERAKSLMGRQAELQKRQQALAELLARDTIDVPASLKIFDEIQQSKTSLERNTFLLRIQIKNLLTPEQQQKLELIAERLRMQKGKEAESAAPLPAPAAVKKFPR